jgi:NAD(P)-dependent dehydrogenase (short-subunit alcohol dehydrogenase family)
MTIAMEADMTPEEPYLIKGKTAVITGGGGVLCSAMASALAHVGVQVAVLDLRLELAQAVVDSIHGENGKAIALQCDVLDKASLEHAAEKVIEAYGRVDILINGAGGNHRMATTTPELSFFELSPEATQWVFNLNFTGTLLPSQVFGKLMLSQEKGNILNISSMNAFRPLTRIPAYSAAKAAVSNFTQWLAVHLAQEYSPNIRVNALAPGFFLTEQNRFLLTEQETGALTARGQKIIDHTPMARFGVPEDLLGAMFFLVSPASAFVTGVVIPIDGGFSAYSGV